MKFNTILAATLAATALGTSPALAQENWETDHAAYKQAMNETVSAERMLTGDVTDGFNRLGDVSNLILDPTGERIEYVLYDVPYPYSVFGDDDGFVRWDNIAIESGGYDGLDLRIDDQSQPYTKDQLEITRGEADDRLVERIVGGDIMFAGGEMREIDDILFDPQTGRIMHYVVEMDEESLFDEDTRLVPANWVSLDEERGYWTVAQPVTYEYEVWVY
jgi:sporulation protein YlmC with PRC-barrel domain